MNAVAKSQAQTDVLIQLRDVRKSYFSADVETPVLHGINVTIYQGEFVAIMGQSGSGKSTLMNILGCLDTPTSGSYVLNGKETAKLNDNELAGGDLFFNKLHCTGCHSGNDFSSLTNGSIGLEMAYKDNGLGALTGDQSSNGVFKVPTLRNVGLTAPYMHDGRFKTLEAVVEHYNSGVQNHTNLSSFLRGFQWQGNGGTGANQSGCWTCGIGTGGTEFKPLNLSQTEKENLVAFLKALTDETLVRDEKFANPFGK